MEAITVQCRQSEAKCPNRILPLHEDSTNRERKNEKNAGERIMTQKVMPRTDLNENDLLLLIRLMSKERVYRFLNEHQQITAQLKNIYDSRLPVFTPLFNRNGRFFMICTGDGRAIGFLRMKYAPENAIELVVAIGEEEMWGQGYGHAGLTEAMKIAFLSCAVRS